MKKITYILLSACFLLTSCEDFLNRDPDAKVGSGDYFTDEGSLLTYINGFIQNTPPAQQTWVTATDTRTSWLPKSRSRS